MQLNMLEAMNIYVNVVEQGSFIRAAEVLELHRPAVTRAVQNLEHDLGVKLLHRTTRQVSMTDEGEEFYQRCLSLLSELDDDATAERPPAPWRPYYARPGSHHSGSWRFSEPIPGY